MAKTPLTSNDAVAVNENETLDERYEREAKEQKEKALNSFEIKQILDTFPGSEVVKVNT